MHSSHRYLAQTFQFLSFCSPQFLALCQSNSLHPHFSSHLSFTQHPCTPVPSEIPSQLWVLPSFPLPLILSFSSSLCFMLLDQADLTSPSAIVLLSFLWKSSCLLNFSLLSVFLPLPGTFVDGKSTWMNWHPDRLDTGQGVFTYTSC